MTPAEPMSLVSLSKRRDEAAAELANASKAVDAARQRLEIVTSALAAMDAAADLSATMAKALTGMRVHGTQHSNYYHPNVKTWLDGGEIGDMWRAVAAFLIADTDDRARMMYATCKNYDRWVNQFCGIDREPHNPRHGSRSWTVTLHPMDAETREACIAIVRAVLSRRITSGALAEATRAVIA